MLRWAIARSRIPKEDLLKKIPRLAEWERGERQPTLRQLQDFARRTMTPLGHLFLPEPPVEMLPLPDFRTIGDTPIDRPSLNLLDTIGEMQQRQAWMREYLIKFFEFYERETNQLAVRQQQRKDRSAGGDFYRTATVRIGRRFGEAIARSVAEGRLLYRDAYRLTGLKGEAFDRFASQTLEER